MTSLDHSFFICQIRKMITVRPAWHWESWYTEAMRSTPAQTAAPSLMQCGIWHRRNASRWFHLTSVLTDFLAASEGEHICPSVLLAPSGPTSICAWVGLLLFRAGKLHGLALICPPPTPLDGQKQGVHGYPAPGLAQPCHQRPSLQTETANAGDKDTLRPNYSTFSLTSPPTLGVLKSQQHKRLAAGSPWLPTTPRLHGSTVPHWTFLSSLPKSEGRLHLIQLYCWCQPRAHPGPRHMRRHSTVFCIFRHPARKGGGIPGLETDPGGVQAWSTSHGEPTVGRVRGWEGEGRKGCWALAEDQHCARHLHVLQYEAVSCSTPTWPPPLSATAGGQFQARVPTSAWALVLFASASELSLKTWHPTQLTGSLEIRGSYCFLGNSNNGGRELACYSLFGFKQTILAGVGFSEIPAEFSLCSL